MCSELGYVVQLASLTSGMTICAIMAVIPLSNHLIKTYGHEGCALIRFIITSLHCKITIDVTAGIMVNTCVVPGCSSKSDRDKNLSFHTLPLSSEALDTSDWSKESVH